MKGQPDAVCVEWWEMWRELGGESPWQEVPRASDGVGSSWHVIGCVLNVVPWVLPTLRDGSWAKGGCKRAQSWKGGNWSRVRSTMRCFKQNPNSCSCHQVASPTLAHGP